MHDDRQSASQSDNGLLGSLDLSWSAILRHWALAASVWAMRENWKFGLAIMAALLISGVGAARADVIDGNWCNSDGRHFSIRGATIITTEGTKAEGNYSRHAFSYTIPSPDPSAGAQVFMLLVNESTVRLRIGADPTAPTQIWRRCDVTS
jgi:hypothetical protein